MTSVSAGHSRRAVKNYYSVEGRLVVFLSAPATILCDTHQILRDFYRNSNNKLEEYLLVY